MAKICEDFSIKTIQKATTVELVECIFKSAQKSTKNGKSTSLILEKARTMIPPHVIAEAISTLHGVDLRWSGPITPSEMEYVKQYVLAKYPEYFNALVEGKNKVDLYNLCIKEEYVTTSHNEKRKTPRGIFRDMLRSNFDYLETIHLEPSRLSDVLAKKSSYEGGFVSIPEIQARKKVLEHCGLPDEEYLVLFSSSYKDIMMLVGESYPFFRGNYYMTFIDQENDHIKEFVLNKDSNVILGPTTWLDLRIKGSQLSQYFRRKFKHSPKGLFSYPVNVDGILFSNYWVSEAHKNSWHVLLDATGLVMGEGKLDLALHRPDFVLCNPENETYDIANVTCLLVRKKSFEASTVDTQVS